MYLNQNLKLKLCSGSQIRIILNGDYFFGESQRRLSGEWSLFVCDNKIYLEDKIEILMSADQVSLMPVNYENCGCKIIGENHIQSTEENIFKGNIIINFNDDIVTLVNEIDIENFVTSILCNNFQYNACVEYLKVQAVVVRSAALKLSKEWNDDLTSNVLDSKNNDANKLENCSSLDLAACNLGDHYKGVPHTFNNAVYQAVKETEGLAFVYNDEVQNIPQTLCCGGITEEISDSISRICDSEQFLSIDLTENDNLERWLYSSPGSYCETINEETLKELPIDESEVQQSFYRWNKSFKEIYVSSILRNKFNANIGGIKEFLVQSRGTSGAIFQVLIKGEIGEFELSKEYIKTLVEQLELPSRSFIVERRRRRGEWYLDFAGVGVGSGTGICHIGAINMAQKGKTMEDIIQHYLPKIIIEKQY